MAANSSLNLTSLDFDGIKKNFVTFLKAQDTFKDYDFSGSNMNVLLDVMSYNTYLNAFYLNMVASEMFLDSAQKLDSVVSHAKELNYVPQSYHSSSANVNIVFETSGLNGKLVIPQATIFSGSNSNGAFYFVTNYNANYSSSNNTYYANNVEIYEGSITHQSFAVDYSIDNQRFILTNPNIDLDSLTVYVLEDNGSSNTLFTSVDTLYGLNKYSNVYFIQAAQNNLYEMVFGDGLFGRKPQNGAVVSVSYRICNGSKADGVYKFQLSQNLEAINNGIINVTGITTVANSSGGSVAETIENIRYRAPRWYATQQRGVSNDDYKSLINARFGSAIQDISVFGGEEIEPKQYGSVVVVAKPYNSTIVTDYLKNEIVNYMADKSQMRVIIKNPDYLYLKVNSNVQYDTTKTSLYSNDIKNVVANTITSFSKTYLERFNQNFRYSKFVTSIDNSDISVISNQTDINVIKRLFPVYNVKTSFDFSFDNSANIEAVDPSKGYNPYTAFSDEPVITSSAFTYVDSDNGIEYPLSYIRDDNVGNLVVYSYINNKFIILNNAIGTVNYSTGHIKINKLLTSYYENYISIYMVPMHKDVIISKDKILLIDSTDVTINVSVATT